MRRSYWLIALALAVLMGAGGLFLVERTFATSSEYRNVERAYARSVEVLLATDRVLLALYDAQRGARGYLIAKEAAYLEPYERGAVDLPRQLARLDRLLEGTKEERLALHLREAATKALAVFENLVSLTRRGRTDQALELVRSGEGKRFTDRAGSLINTIQELEQQSVQVEKLKAAQAAQAAEGFARAIAIMGGISLLMMILAGWLFSRAQNRSELERERAAAAEELGATLAKMRTIIETVPLGLVLAELPSGRIVGGNAFVEKMLRHPVLYSADINSYDEWISYHADGTRVDGSEYPLARMVLAGEENPSIEVNYQRGDGTTAWTRIMGRPVRNDAGEITGGVVALLDVDEERKAKEELQAALKAKDNLLYEVNHRVKNSLQLVVGMLALEAARTRDPAGREAIMSARSKIAVVAQIHQKLYSARSHTSVDFCAYIDELVRGILQSAAQPEDSFRISCDGSPMVNIAIAAPLGLVVNELVTNALKYAFRGEQAGLIIRFFQSGALLTCSIEDRGPGLPADFDLSSSKSMGMKIVCGLVRQVGGTIEATNTGTGAKFEIRIATEAPAGETTAAA